VGFELFQRASGARAQILRVERMASSDGESSAPAFLLTFDVGRILVRSDPFTGSLRAEALESREAVSGPLACADEEEPWWRVLGAPLTAAWESGAEEARGLRLRFRSDDDNPRVIALRPEGASVRASLEKGCPTNSQP
jgi:hypothetical protein